MKDFLYFLQSKLIASNLYLWATYTFCKLFILFFFPNFIVRSLVRSTLTFLELICDVGLNIRSKGCSAIIALGVSLKIKEERAQSEGKIDRQIDR